MDLGMYVYIHNGYIYLHKHRLYRYVCLYMYHIHIYIYVHGIIELLYVLKSLLCTSFIYRMRSFLVFVYRFMYLVDICMYFDIYLYESLYSYIYIRCTYIDNISLCI